MDIRALKREPIDKGWSGDRKYRASDKNGNSFLLRISPAEKYGRRLKEYESLTKLKDKNISVNIPLDFGVCDEGVYTVYNWIDGCDMEEYARKLNDTMLYKYGCEAGKIMKIIHSLPAEASESWADRFNRKIDNKLKAYDASPLKYPRGNLFIDAINANRHLIQGREQTFQHGDYHIGNMMTDSGGRLVIIDFDRFDCGDPWEEFSRIVWCAQKAPAFAKGRIDGYFDGKVPEDFWKLLTLYISVNALSSLPWAAKYDEGQIKIMLEQAEDILRWFDDFKKSIPSWYAFY